MPLKPPKLIDSHAHLNFEAFDQDRDLIIDDCLNSGIWTINVGSSFETSRKAVELAEKYSRGVYATIGVHPIHVFDEDYSQKAMLDLFGQPEKIVAVGETGLDYYHLNSKGGKLKSQNTDKVKQHQQKIFLRHLKLAKILNLPIIFHCRHYENYDAHYDLVANLETFACKNPDFVLKGVMHCYTGSLEMARIYLELGLFLGFTGVITFSDNYDTIIKEVPLERILVETDCPYLSPEPKRGERNVPQFVQYVAEKIADIKGISVKEVYAATVKNTRELFNLN